MNDVVAPALGRLARSCGVLTAYTDAGGRKRESSATAVRAVLSALGIPAATAADSARAMRELRARHLRTPLDPVLVAWDKHRLSIELRIPASPGPKTVKASLTLENGEARTWTLRPDRLPILRNQIVDGTRFRTLAWKLPMALPAG